MTMGPTSHCFLLLQQSGSACIIDHALRWQLPWDPHWLQQHESLLQREVWERAFY